VGQEKLQIRLLKNDFTTKFHLHSLKVSANVKFAMQCFEIFGGRANIPLGCAPVC